MLHLHRTERGSIRSGDGGAALTCRHLSGAAEEAAASFSWTPPNAVASVRPADVRYLRSSGADSPQKWCTLCGSTFIVPMVAAASNPGASFCSSGLAALCKLPAAGRTST